MKVPRSKDDPGKGSYWAIDQNPQEDPAHSRQNRKRRSSDSRLSPYGPEDGRMSPISPQSSPCSSPASPTLASLQSSGGYFGSSPTRHSYMGMSPTVSPNPSPTVAGSGGFGLSQSYGEPPRKIFPEVAFEDLSASFKNLYKSVFDASHGGENFGGGSMNVGMFANSQSLNTSAAIQKQRQQHHHQQLQQQRHHQQQQHQQQQQRQQQQQNNLMQNMELLLESINTGSLQNFDLSTWQMFMDSMKSADLQNIGVDQNQLQDFAFSFSQYLHQQGIIPDANLSMQGVSPSSSSGSNMMGSSPGMLQVSNPQFASHGSPLQGSQQSYSSSASYSGSSVHSIPGIKVTTMDQRSMVQPMNHGSMVQSRSVGIDDDDDEEFDWESLL